MRVDRTRPKRYPWWQLILLGVVGLLEALFRPLGRMWRSDDSARHVRARALRQRDRRRDGRDRARGLGVLRAAGRQGRGQDRRLPGAHDGAARARGTLPRAAARPRGTAPRDLVRRGGRPRGHLRVRGSSVRDAAAVPARVPPARPVEGPLDHEERSGRGVRGPERGARARERAARPDRRGRGPPRARARVPAPEGGRRDGDAVRRGRGVRGRGAAEPAAPAPADPRRAGRGHPHRRDPRLRAPAIGAVGLRAASGFLLFALAFALRRSGEPTWWFAVLAAAATAGGFLGDLARAPPAGRHPGGGGRDRLPHRRRRRGDAVVLRVRAAGADRVRPRRRAPHPSSDASRSRR